MLRDPINFVAEQSRSENTALSDTGGGEETGGKSSTVSTAGFQFLAELSKGPVGPRNQRLPLGQQRRHAEAD